MVNFFDHKVLLAQQLDLCSVTPCCSLLQDLGNETLRGAPAGRWSRPIHCCSWSSMHKCIHLIGSAISGCTLCRASLHKNVEYFGL